MPFFYLFHLFVDGATAWTGTFLTERRATMSATEGVTLSCLVAPEGKGDISQKQQVADIGKRENAEDDIEDGTDSCKPTKV